MAENGSTYHAVFSSEQALRGFAESFGRCLQGGEILALSGPVGAGKTVFAQSLARGLEVPEGIAVTSPTFVLHRRYPGRVVLHHLDVYRLSSELECESLGIYELFESGGVTVVEWADKVRALFPRQTVWISFAITGVSARVLTVQYPPFRFLSANTAAALKTLKFSHSSKG